MKTKIPYMNSVKDLQRILGISQDGILGKSTIDAIKRNKLSIHKEDKRIDSIKKIFN